MRNYKLVIGTANWFCDYNGTRVSEQQADKIIEYADSVGIREYDTARGYADGAVEEFLGKIDNIRVYTKGDYLGEYEISVELLRNKICGYLIHHPTLNYPDYIYMQSQIDCAFGISAYSIREVEMFNKFVGGDITQLPFDVFKQDASLIKPAVMLRKIFNGKTNIRLALEEVSAYCNHWDRVVIGADNVQQLKEIVDIWGTL
jgi:aryl-alcohol dehydrogenase-like predicted oxidoreductase